MQGSIEQQYTKQTGYFSKDKGLLSPGLMHYSGTCIAVYADYEMMYGMTAFLTTGVVWFMIFQKNLTVQWLGWVS